MKNDILDDAIKIVSFDVFDTVLSRTVAEPRGVFDLLSHTISQWKSMLPDKLRNDFTTQRMIAERKARAASSRQDINLHEIYRFLGNVFELPRDVMAKLRALEIKTELECIIGVPKTIESIRLVRSASKRVIFISDMYLPRAVIVRMLKKTGALEDQDNVYISGELGLTKSSGRLFNHVLKAERCSPSEVLHVGDHHSSDFKKPRRFGIKSINIKDAHLNRYEKSLLAGMSSKPLSSCRQALAGASRKARLAEDNSLKQAQADIYGLGANIAGPILFLYALWVLREAMSRNVQRLYFMARDGQVILDVARKILARLRYPLELRYLYGSRQAWSLPSIISLGEDEIRWIFHAEPSLTIRMIAKRLGLAPDLLISYFARAEINIPHVDARLTAPDIVKLSRILLQDDPTKKLILEKAASARLALLSYLDKEKMMEEVPFAIVDSGWYARSQVRLKKILDVSEHDVNMVGLYFGLRSKRNNVSQASYFFDTASPSIYQDWGKAFISIFEVLCSADHGMAMGYSYDKQGFISVQLKERTNKVAIDWGLKILRHGIERFVDSVPHYLYEIDPLEYRENLLEMIKLLISKPNLGEANALGGFRFSSEQTEQQMTCLAPPLSMQEILSSLADKSGNKRRTLTFWPEASLIRSGSLVRMLIPLVAVRPFMKLFGNNR
jgi:HAD superfamily hydrolase (TIGR01549 family)